MKKESVGFPSASKVFPAGRLTSSTPPPGIEGPASSTGRRAEAIGDEAWSDLLRWHDQTLRALLAQHGGEEIDHAGDGFFVAFEKPATAIDCAIEVQRTLAAHRRAHGFAPQVRIGVHSAPGTRSGVGYRGKGIHQAARIAHLAEGGEILASWHTAESCRYPISQPRSITLKGIGQPVQLVTVDWR